MTALPLVWAVFTGAVLNHAADWGLDQVEIDHPQVLAAYGMAPKGEPVGVVAGGLGIVEWDGQVFVDSSVLEMSGKLVGAVRDGEGVAVVTTDGVLRVDSDGQVLEALDELSLPALPLEAVARVAGGVWLQNGEGWHEVTGDWLSFESVGDRAPEAVVKPVQVEDGERLDELRGLWSGGGLSLARVMLDLHAAKFLGPLGKYFYDLVALCTVWLCVTGLILFFRKPGRKREAG